jgi:pilus assembly protein CpaD
VAKHNGDRISIDGGSAYAGSASRDAIAAVAARQGLLLAEGAPVTTGAVSDGMVRVVVSRMAASVPGCPDWSRASQPEYESSTMSNFGCATSSNLAAMVANPEDLIRGREGSADGQVASKAIQSFRAKRPTGDTELKNEATSGK